MVPETITNERVFFFSDYSDLKQDQKRMEHFTSLYGVLIDFVGENNLPNTAELMGIYGRVSVVWIKLNIFKIGNSDYSSVIHNWV